MREKIHKSKFVLISKASRLFEGSKIFIRRIGNGKFITLLILAIFIPRLLLIIITPDSIELPDPVIYRMTGELVSHGLNPYDFVADHEARMAIASNWMKENSEIMPRGIDDFNYYVSANLPASTWLYQIMHAISLGNNTLWRSLLLIGDLGIAAGILALAVSRGVPIYDQWFRIGLLSLTCLYPTLILNGTIIPEEKQFQIALLFIGASTIIWKKWNPIVGGSSVGAALSLGILFKFFSAFLFPLYAYRLLESNWRFRLSSIFVGLALFFVALMQFDINFIDTMSARSVRSSIAIPQHSSVWVLLPDPILEFILPIKIIACISLLSFLIIKHINGKMDFLNFTAGSMIIFAVLWLTDGAINRPNIAMIFALGVILCTDPRVGVFAITSNVIFQAICFVMIFLIGWDLNLFEAICTFGFLVSYLWVILTSKLTETKFEILSGLKGGVPCR